MPKLQQVRRIDAKKSTSSRGSTLFSSCGGSSGSALVPHGISGDYHFGYLEESQAPWAVTTSTFNSHIGNANAHHNRLHSVTSISDHSITADAYAILGATANDTLGLLYIASTGDGINVQKAGSTFTIEADVSDFAGEGLEDDGSNNLAVNLDYDFDWTGQHTFADTISSLGANPATDPITGWRLDADGTAYFADIRATNLTIKTFISDVTLALQGSQIITKSKAIVSRDFTTPATTGTLYVYDLPGSPDTAVFENNDYVRLRYVEIGSGLVVGDVWGTVSSYSDLSDGEQSWTFTRTSGTSGKTIYAGMVALDYGASGDGFIDLTSLGDDTPAIIVNTWASTPTNQTTRAVLGNLARVTDSDYGTLSGFGLFTDNVKLKGTLAAGEASVVIGDSGINIAAGNASAGDINTIQWKEDPFDATTETIASAYAFRYEFGGLVGNLTRISSLWGGSTGADTAGIELLADESVGSGAVARFNVIGQTTPESTLWLEDSGGDYGTFIVKANVQAHGHYVPAASNSFDIGSGTYTIRAIYAEELHVGTTYSTDTGHDHNGLYYTKSEVASYLSGKSDTTHTHDGLVTSVSLATTLSDYVTSSDLATELSSYYTKVAADALLDAKADSVHTHNDLYYTKTQADALFGVVTHSHNLTDLDEKDYSSLTNRGHVLADSDGLGEDHTVSGLTVGHVLRATSATTAKFMQPLYSDLGSRTHAVDGADHSVTASQYAVLSTWGAANTLSMEVATDDGSAGHKLLKTDASGNLTISDLNAADITATSFSGASASISNYITSSNFVSGSAGFYIDGDQAEFGKLTARGAFKSAVFEVDSTAVFSNKQLIVKSSGVVAEAVAINTSGGIEHDIKISFPSLGEFPVAEIGDVLRISGIASYQASVSSGDSVAPAWMFWRPKIIAEGFTSVDIWFTVVDIQKEVDHYVYSCNWESGSDNVTVLNGEAVAVYGKSGDGAIESIATGVGAPYIDVSSHSGSPWTDKASYVRLGQLGGLSAVRQSTSEWGIAAGDLTGATSSYIVLSDQQSLLHSVDFMMTDSFGSVVGLWNSDGIAMAAPLDLQYQNIGDDQAIGGGQPDEDWYAPRFSAINWSLDPSDADEANEYGALRMMTRRAYPDGFGIEGFQTEVRTEIITRGRAIVAGDHMVAESRLTAAMDGEDDASILVRSYSYNQGRVVGSEVEIEADRVRVYAQMSVSGRLTISGMSLTDFPTSEAAVAIGQVYVDAGVLKVKTA